MLPGPVMQFCFCISLFFALSLSDSIIFKFSQSSSKLKFLNLNIWDVVEFELLEWGGRSRAERLSNPPNKPLSPLTLELIQTLKPYTQIDLIFFTDKHPRCSWWSMINTPVARDGCILDSDLTKYSINSHNTSLSYVFK